jgi:predicted RNA-binding protein with PUA-like domain
MVNNGCLMAYWLVKSEPSVWSWAQQVSASNTPWNGVRNNQALGYMRRMLVGDQAFFYHSNEERQIVGIIEITRSFYPDVDDPKSGLVDVKPIRALKKTVTLAQVKSTPALEHIGLVRQSRLSVMEIDLSSWKLLLRMAGE